jgi:hypothetical protein
MRRSRREQSDAGGILALDVPHDTEVGVRLHEGVPLL